MYGLATQTMPLMNWKKMSPFSPFRKRAQNIDEKCTCCDEKMCSTLFGVKTLTLFTKNTPISTAPWFFIAPKAQGVIGAQPLKDATHMHREMVASQGWPKCLAETDATPVVGLEQLQKGC